jgi:hypothetical protein
VPSSSLLPSASSLSSTTACIYTSQSDASQIIEQGVHHSAATSDVLEALQPYPADHIDVVYASSSHHPGSQSTTAVMTVAMVQLSTVSSTSQQRHPDAMAAVVSSSSDDSCSGNDESMDSSYANGHNDQALIRSFINKNTSSKSHRITTANVSRLNYSDAVAMNAVYGKYFANRSAKKKGHGILSATPRAAASLTQQLAAATEERTGGLRDFAVVRRRRIKKVGKREKEVK